MKRAKKLVGTVAAAGIAFGGFSSTAMVMKILRYQVAALVAASIIGGGPWTFNADAATFTVEPTQILETGCRTSCALDVDGCESPAGGHCVDCARPY